MAMLQGHKDILRNNRVFLVGGISLDTTFYAVLRRDNIITEEMNETIEYEKTRKSKVGALLDILPRRGAKAFGVFIEALVKSEQEHIAEILDRKLCAEYVQQKNGGVSGGGLGGGVGVPDVIDAPTAQEQPAECELSVVQMIQDIDSDDKEMTIRVQKNAMNKTNPGDCYPMTRKPRGRVVIISNEYFTDPELKERTGTQEDVKNLTNLFGQLHFTVQLYTNLTAQQIHDTLKKESQHNDHDTADAFVLAAFSHGIEGHIFGMDCEKVSIERMMSYFYSDQCPALMRKPKFFIIQACQGAQGAAPVVLPMVDKVVSDGSSEHAGGDCVDGLANGAIAKADTIVAKATVDGFVAMRHMDKGSWFIRCLIYVMSRNAHKEHLGDMLTKVTKISSMRRDSYIQLPVQSNNTLTNKVYFMP